MEETFGDATIASDDGRFANRLKLADGPLELTWLHCGVTSEFLGDFFAQRHATAGGDYNDARHSIGYLVNELLENAIKFRKGDDIILESSLVDSSFGLRISNMVDSGTAGTFKALLHELTSRDPGELLIERIEANAENAQSNGSGLGLLTLMSDYGARLGWRFSQEPNGDRILLETYAGLDLV